MTLKKSVQCPMFCHYYSMDRADLNSDDIDYIKLEQDILVPLVKEKSLFVMETGDFWLKIKSAGYNGSLLT